ncbi:MAG: hypothetical protein H7834_09405 [Magnetococcus sp. YQC-9]
MPPILMHPTTRLDPFQRPTGSIDDPCGIGWRLLLLFVWLFPASGLAMGFENLQINGFGTLGWIHDDNATSAFVRDLNQRPKDSLPEDRSWFPNDSWLRDSRLGLQANLRLSSDLSVMTQMVLRNQITHNPGYHLDWALLAWTPMPDLDLRFGRVGYDLFLVSEQRNMGYGYPWIRPPVEFYGWIPLYSLDGFDGSYAWRSNAATWRFKVQGGRSIGIGVPMDEDLYRMTLDQAITATLTYEEGRWLFKAGHSHLRVASEAKPLTPLFNALDGLAGMGLPSVEAQAADLRRNMTFDASRIRLSTVGLVYDDKDWLVQAELGTVSSSIEMNVNHDIAYAGVAKRWGDWTPYTLISAIRPHHRAQSISSNWGDGLPANLEAALNGLQQASILAINSSRIHQETMSLGVRYDLNPWAALKWQWDGTHVHPNGYLLRPGTLLDGSQPLTVQAFSVSLDFVF